MNNSVFRKMKFDEIWNYLPHISAYQAMVAFSGKNHPIVRMGIGIEIRILEKCSAKATSDNRWCWLSSLATMQWPLGLFRILWFFNFIYRKKNVWGMKRMQQMKEWWTVGMQHIQKQGNASKHSWNFSRFFLWGSEIRTYPKTF